MQKLTQASTALALTVQRSFALSLSGNSSPGLLRKVLPAAVVPCCGSSRRRDQSSASSSSQSGGSSGSGSEPTPGRKVVSVSSILSQDGLEIQELPILVRLLDRNTVPLASSHTYPGEEQVVLLRPMSAEDENFQFLLRQCRSVKDVFMLLEIPSERVTGHSASAALRRLCELQKMSADWDDLHSFVRTAVMRELNDTVRRDVGQLSNETLVSLVSCYMHMADSFTHECVSVINGEIERRMAEGLIPIEDLCSVSVLLHVSDRGDRALVDGIWAHVASRVNQDLDEGGLVRVLDSLPASHRHLLKVLGRRVQKVWWKMREEEVVGCLNALVRHNSLQAAVMADFSRWLFLNVHSISEANLMQFVAAFIHFRFSDAKFVVAVERYVGGAQGERLGASLLGLVVEYCRQRRHFSPTILDAAARHFVCHGDTYSALQMFTVLRTFGQLNYLPRDSHHFLLQTERMLELRFDEFQPAHLAELLCSFAFVEKIPLNFVQKVLTPSFLSRVKGVGQADEAGLWLEMLQSAVKLETRGVRVPYLYKKQHGVSWKDDRMCMLQSKLEETLKKIFGSSAVRVRTFAPNTIYTIDAEMHLDKDGKPVPVSFQGGQQSSQVSTRLAVVIMAVDHYCVNSGHLLGEFTMRLRHLRKLGYVIVEVFDAEFLPMNVAQREWYLMGKLKKWVHRDAFNGRPTTPT